MFVHLAFELCITASIFCVLCVICGSTPSIIFLAFGEEQSPSPIFDLHPFNQHGILFPDALTSRADPDSRARSVTRLLTPTDRRPSIAQQKAHPASKHEVGLLYE
jgi:hypothetical protein